MARKSITTTWVSETPEDPNKDVLKSFPVIFDVEILLKKGLLAKRLLYVELRRSTVIFRLSKDLGSANRRVSQENRPLQGNKKWQILVLPTCVKWVFLDLPQ